MPVYCFRCPDCGAETEQLLPLGETAPRPCPDCRGVMRHRFGRVAIRYAAFGFAATDKLVSDPGTKDFKALSAKAEEISDS